MEFKWIVKYEDDKRTYEDGYLDEQTAKEYYEEAKAEGYINVSYFEKKFKA
jgi:hypothetical protein